ncbi:MAG TPA: hypothetical protein VHT31_02515, partial [Candidatus Acidoferrum sp.]|nr:hypothetical protein [Candidatus Acidoferrum sp.]
AFASSCTKLVTKMTGDNQGARWRVEAGLGFQYANAAAAARYCTGSVQARGGTADNNYFAIFPAWPGNIIYLRHRLICPTDAGV